MSNYKVEQGKRLRAVRQMVGLTLRELAELSSIGESTIRQWETGRSKGISIKGAYKLIKAFEACNVLCEVEWLIEGKGSAPEITSEAPPLPQIKSISPDKLTEMEIKFFCEHSLKPIISRLNDKSMSPLLPQGTYIGGNLIPLENIHNHNNEICIMTLIDGSILIRTIVCDENRQDIKLVPLNQSFDTIENPQILSIAPATRLWR